MIRKIRLSSSDYMVLIWMFFLVGMLTFFVWEPGFLVHRDMVSVPQTYFTDFTLGLDGGFGRAVPQEWLIAIINSIIPGKIIIKILVVLFLCLIYFFADRLILVNGIVKPTLLARISAASLAIYNPWIGERLLQGQWSLLTVVVSLLALTGFLFEYLNSKTSSSKSRMTFLTKWSSLTALGALTYSGWIILTIFTLVTLVFLGEELKGIRVAMSSSLLIIALLWLVPNMLNTSVTIGTGAGVSDFSIRAENFTGRGGAVLSLGGIWNAYAMPKGRGMLIGGIGSILLIASITVGVFLIHKKIVRENKTVQKIYRTSLSISLGGLFSSLLFSLEIFQKFQIYLTEQFSVLEVFRDTQKFSSLAIPLYALALGEVANVIKVKPIYAAGLMSLIIYGNVPGLPQTLFREIKPITYATDWDRVAMYVNAQKNPPKILVIPANIIKNFPGVGTTVDPALRFFRANVIEFQQLKVGDNLLEIESNSDAVLGNYLYTHRGLPNRDFLAKRGYQFILKENFATKIENQIELQNQLKNYEKIYQGKELSLYQISRSEMENTSPPPRYIMTFLHICWFLLLFSYPIYLISCKLRLLFSSNS